jgi:thiol-disulfide isomerase/thioredoxin
MYLRFLLPVALPGFIPGISWLCLAAAATAADPAAHSVLHLTNGSFIPGESLASEDPKVLRWRSPYFVRPFEFPLGAIQAVHYAVPAQQPKPSGEYCFELVDGDVLYGDLLGLTDDTVEVDAARFGRLRLRREQVRRFYRWQGADLIYLGPNGLAGWKDAAATPQWRDEGGQLLTDQAGATLFGDLGLPEKAVIEVELSWKEKPDFVFALGVADRDWTAPHAFQFEVWDDELVAVGESARDADVAAVQQVGAGAGRARVQVCLDQAQRRLILLSQSSKPLATLKLDTNKIVLSRRSKPPATVISYGNKPPIYSGVHLMNRKGDVRLEYLRITRWSGQLPREVREEQARLHRADGSIVYGHLAAFDPESKQFTLRDGTTETRVPHEAIADVFLSPARVVGKAATGSSGEALRLIYRDGARFSGTPTRMEDTHLTLACPGVRELLRLPLADLRSLLVLRPGEGPTVPVVAGKPGRLELEGVRLKGQLVHGSEQPDASCLVWHPDLGLNASPLRPGLSGRIVYRDPPPPPRPSNAEAQRLALQNQGFAKVIARVQRGLPAPPPSTGLRPLPSGGRGSLHLRSGDTIPCVVTGMDDKGVTFKTPLSDATFVAHEKIKSVELLAMKLAPLDEVKRDRLLTLPRFQKGSPPTHLVCSKNGDFLRGRVLEMDEARLKIEVRLETREIPRERVAQIIWLHADELTGQRAASTAGDFARVTRVQTVRADGNRLTFVAEQSDLKTVAGRSEVLGACRMDLAEVDQLLFGTFIEQSAAKLASHLWKLHPATEPKFAQADLDGSADGGVTGIESPLVGQPAFSFKLDLLDGSKFHLAGHKGRVVVLEFWATWCGPCLQSMPLIEGVVREFAGQPVELLAVNLEEQPEQIKSMLERHKLKLPVALDRDGVVAARYAVTAIPQTVVIDRDGKVARVFVGGGKKMAESLRKAIQELSAVKPSPGASP